MSLTAPEPQLPSDLTVTAVYGAGEETYYLANPSRVGEVLFCSQRDGAGASSNRRGVLDCELWTDSAVTLRAKSELYAPIERELAPMVDRCGVVTTQVELELLWPPEEGE